jgi:glycosyltransferase involved in cell wall biosynthesis
MGGGRSLLFGLLSVLPKKIEVLAILDSRMEVPQSIAGNIRIIRTKPTVYHRLMAEKQLSSIAKHADIVLCFGNLPPLFKLKGHTKVFLQNRYLIDKAALTGFPLKTFLRLNMERLWVYLKFRNCDEFIVQTPTMKAKLECLTGKCKPVRVLPFTLNSEGYSRNINKTITDKNTSAYDFAYVASGEPHKNHQQLLDAWCLLAKDGLFPSLCLTVDKETWPGLFYMIEDKREKYGLKLNNLGLLSHDEVKHLYTKVRALVYPSIFESFGMPMVEARQAGLPVLAAELDYVRDVLDPEQTFDPNSAMSIARAVKRFLGQNEQPLQLLDAESFMKYIMEKIE